MRKFFFILAAIAVVFAMSGCGQSITCDTYTCKAVVTAVSDDVVTIVDEGGFIWEFYGDGFTKGDQLRVTFEDTNTAHDAIIDAEIL